MKHELENKVKEFGGWSKLEVEMTGKVQKSLKRKIIRMIDLLDMYLEKLNLELSLRDKNEEKK